MTYEQVKHLKPEQFKRLCGVRPETFKQMVVLLRQAKQQLKVGRLSNSSGKIYPCAFQSLRGS